jgi:hypothetical protein
VDVLGRRLGIRARSRGSNRKDDSYEVKGNREVEPCLFHLRPHRTDPDVRPGGPLLQFGCFWNPNISIVKPFGVYAPQDCVIIAGGLWYLDT